MGYIRTLQRNRTGPKTGNVVRSRHSLRPATKPATKAFRIDLAAGFSALLPAGFLRHTERMD